jgi:hypothetical protein
MGTTWFDVTKFLAKLCEEYGVLVSCTSDENARAESGIKTEDRGC